MKGERLSSPLRLRRLPPRPISAASADAAANADADHRLVVSGGGRLAGHVGVSGSKNAALAVLAGALCCSSGAFALRGVPDLSDTRTMAAVLRSLGARVEEHGGGEVVVDAGAVTSVEPDSEAIGRIRAGFFVLGPLVARFGEAEVALPGGCRIGARPIDLYLRGLAALGAVVQLRHGKVRVEAANGKGLVGGQFHLDYPSVGATETLMTAASLADGVTILSNVAREPEVADLAKFLVTCGAQIEGAGTSTLVINGKKRLHGAEFTIIPDRIEAGTLMVAAAITRSCISLSPVIPGHLTSIMDKLSAAGCKIIQKGRHILEVSALSSPNNGDLQGFYLKTLPYPGFPTDLQPQFMALLTTCSGLSVVEESVFENRMHHVKELQKLGARIRLSGSSAFIQGKRHRSAALSGCPVEAADLRGGAALVLAGMAVEGVTEISGVSHIDRGYENFEAKLLSLGANIERKVEHQQQLMTGIA
ncbi:uncharacterized protein LOC109722091 [Ananas comosus]|uniref:UDP-N-acetylglucosamine 1-carboxyvinyltransferase n=1 Tax=Ananas comosus TaxID=4615 RepID=A0A6P5GAB8_ANACO|nr:uncharacterized protein LOC109722091 [Ananas comosus]